jgi:DNA primase
MQSLLKLPNLTRAPVDARPKLTRTTLSMHKRYCLMLLMQPALASRNDLSWAEGNADEDILLQQTIETCLTHPHSKPIVIMRALESRVDAKVLAELERELNVLDETLDLAEELVGARRQLEDAYVQKKEALLLAQISDKPLSALTENERTLLKSLGNKRSQNRA